MQTIISIDFSVNFPTICIYKDEIYKFICFVRNKSLTKKLKHNIELLSSTGNIEFVYLDDIPDYDNYTDEQFNKLLDGIEITNKIIDTVFETYYDKNTIVAIEGFSYSSNGNRSMELCGYQYILRKELYERYNIKLEIYAPTTIKKFAGKGNWNKIKMTEAFFNNNIIQHLYSDFFTINHNLLIDNKMQPVKPFEDIVDTFWMTELIRNNSVTA